ncbi:hypothetical protein ACHWQZ_G014214 [Mnemiopsis leidyi]
MSRSLSYTETNWSLCGSLACDNGISRIFLGRQDLCQKQNTCKNLDQAQKKRLNCCKSVNEDARNESQLENCLSSTEQITSYSDNNVPTNDQRICNGFCDNWNCIDESECNGFFYGKVCNIGSLDVKKVTYYTPAFEICDGKSDCYSYPALRNATLDEEGCDKIFPGTSRCISGELHRSKSKKIMIPIYNFTRCSTIIMANRGLTATYRYSANWTTADNLRKFGLPYCLDHLDQTNCTDPKRVAVSCEVEGYGYSTISRAMVCGGITARRRLCVDGMDLACVDVDRSCTLHKHQLCDGIRDCGSGADENHPSCLILTKHKCLRNFRTDKALRIPIAWLGDGLEDCLNGLDENWTIECGLKSTVKRFEVNDVCQDVFLCRYGASNFIRLNELCDGMDKCGNENAICEVGRGLTSLSSAVISSGKVKNMKYCLKGLEDVVKRVGSLCISRDFNPFNENLYGIVHRTRVIYPTEKSDCNFVYGEAYVLLSCLGKCRKSPCPLIKPVAFNDCPGQYRNRIYTVADQHRLTFVNRRANTYHRDYHNDYFICKNGMCAEYDKVCNLWDDCGDSSDETNCTNSFHCKGRHGIIPLTKKCDGIPDCGDMSDECNSDCSREIINIPVLKVAAWLIGITAMVSNTLILFENGYSLKDFKSVDTLVNKLLVMLIGLGDLLVSAYLFAIAVVDLIYFGERYCSRQFEWLTSIFCSTLGVVSTFGTLVSLFSLTILSTLRAAKIYGGDICHGPPHQDGIGGRKKIAIAILMMVIVGSAAFISLITLSPSLEEFFVNGFVYDQSIKIFHGHIGKQKHMDVIQSYYGRSMGKTSTWRVIESLVRAMFSNDYGNLDNKIFRVEFYGNDGVCLFKFFVTHDDPQRVFSLAILTISMLCFSVVAAAYIYINFSAVKSSSSLTKEPGPTADAVNKRNRKLQRKVATIILTDFICWVPFILVGFLHYFEVLDATPLYGFFSIIMLPINSVINPFLYSDLMSKLAKRVGTVFTDSISKFKAVFASYTTSLRVGTPAIETDGNETN